MRAMDYRYGPALRDRIADNLAKFTPRAHEEGGLKRAAVAITLVADGRGEAAYTLTRRSPRLNKHAGQWALPGGRVDPGETAVAGALRELAEEVELRLDAGAVLGVLDDYPTKSGYLITPVVVWAGARAEMRANPDEVASIHRITLRELDRPDSPVFFDIPESPRAVIQILIGDQTLHAPTAAMVYQFREVAVHGRRQRVDHLGEPVWAWR